MKGTRNKQLYNKLPRHKIGGVQAATGALGMLSNVYGNLNQPYAYQPQYKQSTVGGVGYQEEQQIDTTGQGANFGSALSGVASGAAAGAALGPIGAGVGALVGGVSSLIGAGARKRKMDAENVKMKARNSFNAAGAHTKGLQNDFAMNDTNEYMQYVAQGGVITNPNARVDEGEVMQEPNGNVETVENSNPNVQQVQPNTTDGYVANLKEGTRILSNKIKIPGSKQTFAEAGQKIESKLNAMKKREPKSHIEANTARLNESNLQKQYNDLFAAQEAVKGLKMRPEGSYAKGGKVRYTPAPVKNDTLYIQPGEESENIKKAAMNLSSIHTLNGGHTDRYTDALFHMDLNSAIDAYTKLKNIPELPLKSYYDSNADSIYNQLNTKRVAKLPVVKYAKGGQVGDGYQSVQYKNLPGYADGKSGITDRLKLEAEYFDMMHLPENERNKMIDSLPSGSKKNDFGEMYAAFDGKRFEPGTTDTNEGLPVAYTSPKSQLNPENFTNIPKFSKKDYTNYNSNTKPSYMNGDNQSSTWSDIMNLAPSLMNIANSFDSTYKAQNISPESMVSDNPYEGQVLSALKRRRTRVQPLLDQNNMNSNIARYNSRQSGTGNRYQDVAIAAGKMRADQEAINSTNKINDSYLTDYANTLNQFGQQKASQMASAKQYANQYNNQQLQQQYQASEARRGLLNAGLKGVSDYRQMKDITSKKNLMDEKTLRMLEQYYKNYNNKPIWG